MSRKPTLTIGNAVKGEFPVSGLFIDQNIITNSNVAQKLFELEKKLTKEVKSSIKKEKKQRVMGGKKSPASAENLKKISRIFFSAALKGKDKKTEEINEYSDLFLANIGILVKHNESRSDFNKHKIVPQELLTEPSSRTHDNTGPLIVRIENTSLVAESDSSTQIRAINQTISAISKTSEIRHAIEKSRKLMNEAVNEVLISPVTPGSLKLSKENLAATLESLTTLFYTIHFGEHSAFPKLHDKLIHSIKKSFADLTKRMSNVDEIIGNFLCLNSKKT